MSREDFDRQMMRSALAVARRGLGNTAPNPAVGAVIADEVGGEVLARGWTQPGGRPHAETEAIRRAGERARRATLYVTLEPCAHFGKTPPCADAIIAAGLTRVVVGTGDPDPRTKGQGIARLVAAGLEVTEGVLADDCARVTLGHILRVTEQRPFVQLKMAFAAEGTVPRGSSGRPVFATGPDARAMGHLLRAEADAIVVGAGTVIDDDPDLTCRLPGLADKSPVRIVLAGRRSIPLTAKLIVTARETPTWVVVSGAEGGSGSDAEVSMALAACDGVRVSRCDGGLNDLLAWLAADGITRLLVEGGPLTWARFAEAGLVDEVVVFQARGQHARGGAIERAKQAMLAVSAAFAPFLSTAILVGSIEHRALPSDDIVTFYRSPVHQSCSVVMAPTSRHYP